MEFYIAKIVDLHHACPQFSGAKLEGGPPSELAHWVSVPFQVWSVQVHLAVPDRVPLWMIIYLRNHLQFPHRITIIGLYRLFIKQA